jgi:hypothetical protein
MTAVSNTNVRASQANTARIYPGQGSAEDPFIVDFGEGDTENPREYPAWKKWWINISVRLRAFTTSSIEKKT